MSALNKFKLALIQLSVKATKTDNLQRATELIKEAAKNGASVVALPECCNSPYGNDYFPEYAEEIPGTSTEVFSKAAADNKIHLFAGSIPERCNGKLYNTNTVFGPDGSLVSKFRKVHLFDIDIPGKITFQESKTLTAGDCFSIVDTPFCKIGVGICYDIRFAEMAQIYSRKGNKKCIYSQPARVDLVKLLLYPGAFNMTTGPAHWELLQRARAVDNQLYVATVSPARDPNASYVAWGHSTIVNPWGEVVATCDEKEQIVYAEIDLDFLKDVRARVPITTQRRTDLYDVTPLQ